MENKVNLCDYRQQFDRLQAIAYRNIDINGTGIRLLGIHYMDNGPDWSVKRHKHTFFEFHYVADGYTYTVINNIEYKILAGSFYLMPPGTCHSHRQDLKSGHKGFALRWEFIDRSRQNELLDSFGMELSRIRNVLTYAHSHPLADNKAIMDNMLRILEMAGSSSGILAPQLEFCQMLINMAGLYTQEVFTGQAGVNYNFFENNTVNSAIRFMEENYTQDISVSDVSNSVHLSYSHLARLFKKHTDASVISHLNRLRLKRAQWLLGCSEKSIAEIAIETGYNNDHYFCTAFKKAFGMTPGHYRHIRTKLSE